VETKIVKCKRTFHIYLYILAKIKYFFITFKCKCISQKNTGCILELKASFFDESLSSGSEWFSLQFSRSFRKLLMFLDIRTLLKRFKLSLPFTKSVVADKLFLLSMKLLITSLKLNKLLSKMNKTNEKLKFSLKP